jgi:hypothetical protein
MPEYISMQLRNRLTVGQTEALLGFLGEVQHQWENNQDVRVAALKLSQALGRAGTRAQERVQLLESRQDRRRLTLEQHPWIKKPGSGS